MSDMLQLLMQTMGGNTLGQISRQIGADEDSTAKAISGALPILLGALDRNTDRPGGAESLFGALSRDHDGGILDNIDGFLNAGQTSAGDKILGHVLGVKRPAVEKGLSRSSGLDMGTIAKLLPLLAPIVMGYLGRTQRQKGLDAQGLSSLLTGERRAVEKQAPDVMGVLGSLLDTNDDGQVVDDVVKIGSSLLGGLLGGPRR